MARRPVHLTAAGKRPEGRQVIWEAIRRRREFTISDLEDSTRINEETIRTYVTGLTRAGYLDREEPEQRPGERFQPSVWRLINDVGIEAPRVRRDGSVVTQGRGREQLWRTMRILGEFDYRELAVQASTEAHPIAMTEAQTYCQYLHRAGYLADIVPGGPNRPARYRLLMSRYSGPQAPQIQRIRQVWDPNLQQVVWRPREGVSHD